MQQIDIRTHYVPRSTLTGMFQGARYVPLKRAVDVLLACALLLIFAPIMALIALAIKSFSPGPILLRQRRIGCGGIPFAMVRFRTTPCARKYAPRSSSRDSSEAHRHPASLDHEPDTRADKLAALLRASRLDQLPQLFNVLRGDMSLVGPRPAQPRETELYEAWHRQRLSVPPGITGLWQVSGQSKRPIDDMARADLAYIATMSLWLDLRIMLRTPGILLRGRRRSV